MTTNIDKALLNWEQKTKLQKAWSILKLVKLEVGYFLSNYWEQHKFEIVIAAALLIGGLLGFILHGVYNG
jgi:hypothetical protein